MNYKQISQNALDKVNSITPSILVLARHLKVAPTALAGALVDNDKNGVYLKDLSVAMIDVLVEKAREDEEAEKKSE